MKKTRRKRCPCGALVPFRKGSFAPHGFGQSRD